MMLEQEEKINIDYLIEAFSFVLIKTKVPTREVLEDIGFNDDLELEDFEDVIGESCFVLYDFCLDKIREIYLADKMSGELSLDIIHNLSSYIDDSYWEDVMTNFIPEEDHSQIKNFEDMLNYLNKHDVGVSDSEKLVIEALATGNPNLFKEYEGTEQDLLEALKGL